jgi:aminopeptidase N
VFFGGLRRYFEAHAYGNAEFDDLMSAWTAVGAVGLQDWAASWLRTSGMDTIDVVRGHGMAMIEATPPQGQDVTRIHAVQVGAVDSRGGVFGRTAIILDGQPVGVEVPDDVRLLIPDVGDETWAKIRLGSGSWDLVADALSSLTEPAARVVLYNSVRDAVRNAELSSERALDLHHRGGRAVRGRAGVDARLRPGAPGGSVRSSRRAGSPSTAGPPDGAVRRPALRSRVRPPAGGLPRGHRQL